MVHFTFSSSNILNNSRLATAREKKRLQFINKAWNSERVKVAIKILYKTIKNVFLPSILQKDEKRNNKTECISFHVWRRISISFRFNAIFYFGLGYAYISGDYWNGHTIYQNSCVERASSNSIEIETWFLMVINRLHIGLFYRESFWIEDNVSLNTKYYNP